MLQLDQVPYSPIGAAESSQGDSMGVSHPPSLGFKTLNCKMLLTRFG